MRTPPFFAVQKQEEDGETILVAVNYTLNQNDINPKNNLTLYVDTLTIPAKRFTLQGKNITIYSRNIIAEEGAAFDTSAGDHAGPVLPHNPPQAPNGAAQGDRGRNGAHGAAGAQGIAAGNITIHAGAITGTIFIKAVGGRGQQGQKGQDAGHGMRGTNGKDAVTRAEFAGRALAYHRVVVPAENGGNGAQGGDGGNAGRSGNGGNGGAINIRLVTPATAGAIRHENMGGPGGHPAQAGLGGNGGVGGIGGLVNARRSRTNRQPPGQNGNPGRQGFGAGAALQGNAGLFGLSGDMDPAGMLNNNTSMLAMLTLTMRYAEIEYISGSSDNLAKAITYYQWVEGLTSGITTGTGLQAEFAALYRQSSALLNQLSQGLDFYANPMSYVPIVALNHYQVALESMLNTGRHIETVYNSYEKFLRGETREFNDMHKAIAQSKEAIKAYQRIQANVKTQIEALPAVFDQLGTALMAQHHVLMNVNDAFKEAVRRRNGCDFATVVSVVKTVVNVGKNVFAAWKKPAIGTIATSVTDLVRLGISIHNGSIVRNPRAIPGDPNSVAAAWRSINPSGVGDVGDDTRLIVLRDEFDKTVEPYLSMPEAREYQKQLHDFIGIAEARNAKLLEYTNAIIQYANVIGVIAQKEEEVKRIEAQIAREHVPDLITYRNFMFNLYQDFKSFVLKYLYQEHRAYIYWSHSSQEFEVKNNSFAGLSDQHAQITAGIIEHINGTATPQQPIEDRRIELTSEGREEQFAEFRSTGRLTFNINPDEDHFLGWANVMLTNFSIHLNGKRLDEEGSEYYIQLIHHGSVFVIDPSDEVHEYTHNQVRAAYRYRIEDGAHVYEGGGSLGGDDTGDNRRRIALSPYATFTIALPPRFNPDLDLAGLESISIHFSGHAELPSKMSMRLVAVN